MPKSEDTHTQAEVDRFILDRIHSIPQLEALLLLWRDPAESWGVEDAARRLWLDPEQTRIILRDLARQEFLTVIEGELERFLYRTDPGNDRILPAVAHVYRREMIRVSGMIHSKMRQD